MAVQQVSWSDVTGEPIDLDIESRADTYLSNLASATAARENLGLGALATASTAVLIAGASVSFTAGGAPGTVVTTVVLPAAVAGVGYFDLDMEGVPQRPGTAYTRSGATLTFPAGVPGDAAFVATPLTLSFS